MKNTHIFAIVLTAAVIFGPSLAIAQAPAPAMKPAPPTPAPAMAPVAAPVAPKATAPAQPTPAPATAPQAATKPVPGWKKPEFWISSVILPVLLFVLGLGWFKKTWAQWMKEKGILVVADKVASGFEAYAAQTPALWDDALAQALKAVVARFGELTPEQEAVVKGVIEERKAQSETARNGGQK